GGAVLEPRSRLGGPVGPGVGPPQHVDPAEGPVFCAAGSLVDRDAAEDVICGRCVVVTVADVLPADDAGQPRYIGNRTCARDCPWHTYGTDTGPAERWRRDGRDERPLRLGDDAQRPLTLRGRKTELADELLDVEELGVRLVTHLKDRLTPLDP